MGGWRCLGGGVTVAVAEAAALAAVVECILHKRQTSSKRQQQP